MRKVLRRSGEKRRGLRLDSGRRGLQDGPLPPACHHARDMASPVEEDPRPGACRGQARHVPFRRERGRADSHAPRGRGGLPQPAGSLRRGLPGAQEEVRLPHLPVGQHRHRVPAGPRHARGRGEGRARAHGGAEAGGRLRLQLQPQHRELRSPREHHRHAQRDPPLRPVRPEELDGSGGFGEKQGESGGPAEAGNRGGAPGAHRLSCSQGDLFHGLSRPDERDTSRRGDCGCPHNGPASHHRRGPDPRHQGCRQQFLLRPDVPARSSSWHPPPCRRP